MARLIKIDNLPASIDSLALQHLFEFHGAVRSAMIAPHLETGCGATVGFIEMESAECAWEAILALNLRERFGQVLSVGWSEDLNARFTDRDQMFGPMNLMSDEMIEDKRDQ